ncbi:MAG: hypothetical protein KGD67_00785 [Candidatus Lokiarchaeota archaeon]|nr:hypothetical protein [Candidatus Lokiarchaeota archaeon]
MAWTPPSKFTVIFSFLLVAGGLFILIELFFAFTGILPALALGPLSSTETWGIIGMGLVFLAWFLMFLGVRLKGI